MPIAPGGVDGVHQGALVVGLEAFDVQPVRGAGVFGELLDVGQRGGAVFLGFTGAEQVQVGAVEDQDGAAAGFGGGGCVSHVSKSIASGTCRGFFTGSEGAVVPVFRLAGGRPPLASVPGGA